MSSSILFQSSSSIISIIDIPKSIEEAQGYMSSKRRLISTNPREHPYPSTEPKSAKAIDNTRQPSLQDLLLIKRLELALKEIKEQYRGPWYSPRITAETEEANHVEKGKKRRRDEELPEEEEESVKKDSQPRHFHNSNLTSMDLAIGSAGKAIIPPKSTFLLGNISETIQIFKSLAPKFDLIILDPPWPNRSARRKKSYEISYGNQEIRSLLCSIPIYDHVADDGLVAIWITNKPSIYEMVVEEGGLFEEWGLRLVEEWIWLKVTSDGEPVCALDSTWRKPYEVLLVGQRGSSSEDVKRKVIVGVPDLHSRKPNLSSLFEGMMGKGNRYEGLEIFARNLAAGWWSWGNEALKFQDVEHWAL